MIAIAEKRRRQTSSALAASSQVWQPLLRSTPALSCFSLGDSLAIGVLTESPGYVPAVLFPVGIPEPIDSLSNLSRPSSDAVGSFNFSWYSPNRDSSATSLRRNRLPTRLPPKIHSSATALYIPIRTRGSRTSPSGSTTANSGASVPGRWKVTSQKCAGLILNSMSTMSRSCPVESRGPLQRALEPPAPGQPKPVPARAMRR